MQCGPGLNSKEKGKPVRTVVRKPTFLWKIIP